MPHRAGSVCASRVPDVIYISAQCFAPVGPVIVEHPADAAGRGDASLFAQAGSSSTPYGGSLTINSGVMPASRRPTSVATVAPPRAMCTGTSVSPREWARHWSVM